jgi:hypothetical protein
VSPVTPLRGCSRFRVSIRRGSAQAHSSRNPSVEQRRVYSIYYNGTLTLPSIEERGEAVEAVVVEVRWWERTRDVIITETYRLSIYNTLCTLLSQLYSVMQPLMHD